MCRKTQEEPVCVLMFFCTRLSSWVHLGSTGSRSVRKAELPEKRDLGKNRDQTVMALWYNVKVVGHHNIKHMVAIGNQDIFIKWGEYSVNICEAWASFFSITTKTNQTCSRKHI